MENETLIAENVEVDMDTLNCALSQQPLSSLARWKVLEILIEAFDPEDRKKLEDYRNQ